MNSDDLLANFVSSDSYTNVNDNLVKGLEGDAYSAFILSKFISLFKYFYSNGFLIRGGYFFQTIDTLEKCCGITEARQRSAIHFLESKGLLKQKLFGSPPRRHFKLNSEKIVELMSSNNKKEKTEITIDKEEFYDKLNIALNTSWEETINNGGNINRHLLWFMYVWCYNVKIHCSGSIFEFSPKTYGELVTYWRGRYKVRLFNYQVLYDYFQRMENKCSLYDLISYDRAYAEVPYNKEIHDNNMAIENEWFKE